MCMYIKIYPGKKIQKKIRISIHRKVPLTSLSEIFIYSRKLNHLNCTKVIRKSQFGFRSQPYTVELSHATLETHLKLTGVYKSFSFTNLLKGLWC